MDAWLLLQYVLIGLAVAISVVYVFNKQWPTGVRKLRIACAVPLLRDGRGVWLHKLGRWIAPVPKGGDGGCGTGCDGCGPTPPER